VTANFVYTVVQKFIGRLVSLDFSGDKKDFSRARGYVELWTRCWWRWPYEERWKLECGIKPKYQNISCDFVEKNLKLFNLEEKVIEPVKKRVLHFYSDLAPPSCRI